MASFARLLQQYRKDAGLTQVQLAKKLNRSRTTISDWENEKYLPEERQDILSLEDILGLLPSQLDSLLLAAQKPLKYQTSENELEATRPIDTLKAGLVIAERLEITGPPTPPPAPLRTRIPGPRTKSLVGRSDELDWLCRRLQAGDVAALAGVRGIGGIGKTELAIAAARQLESHFEGRVIWLDAGPNDIFALQTRLAAALGIQLSSDDLPVRADSLDLALRRQPATLMVLDDLRKRHLADLRYLPLPRPPCAVLLTSRRTDLGLPAEAIKRLKVLDEAPAKALLANLLPAEWLAAEPEALAGMLALLDNIPLALRLAANRALEIAQRADEPSRTRPLATLLVELEARRMQVLNQGEDPERPDLSVVITFNASYDDLAAADQARLRRLGVFARSEFGLAALQAVWGDDERAARQALRSLVNAGLLEETRPDVWWMHDLLREYAADRLGDDPAEEQAARLAHAVFWRDYLSQITLRQVEDWQSLETQRPEIEHAAYWFLSDWQRQPVLASSLALWIAQKFLNYSFPQLELLLRASLNTFQELMQAAGTEEEIRESQRSVAVTQSSLADLLRTRGHAGRDEAERLYRESLAVKEKVGDSRSVAVTQSSLADLLSNRGQYDEAERLYMAGLAITRAIRDPQDVAVFLMGLGQLALARGQQAEAISLLQQARQGFAALRLDHWVAQVDELLARAEKHGLTLADLLAMLKAAGRGDQQAGQQAWDICGRLAQSAEAGEVALGRALQRILSGEAAETALAALPADLRGHILEELGRYG
jgi:transcriptional regulator with XRE-family HTH domain